MIVREVLKDGFDFNVFDYANDFDNTRAWLVGIRIAEPEREEQIDRVLAMLHVGKQSYDQRRRR